MIGNKAISTMSTLRLVVSGALVCALLSGCAENRASFFVQLIKAPNTECIVESSEDGTYLTSGILDLAYRRSYTLTPLMRNQLTARGDNESFISESNGIQVEGANVQLFLGPVAEGTPFGEVFSPARTYVHPENVAASVFEAFGGRAMEQFLSVRGDANGDGEATDEELRDLNYTDQITINVSMIGTTNGGQSVETPYFAFPVNLCYGCLTDCSVETIDETVDGAGFCSDTSAPSEIPCFLGQDQGIDCRLCVPLRGLNECQGLCGR